jgi:hypothetical protein
VKDVKTGGELMRLAKELVGDEGSAYIKREFGNPNFTPTILPTSPLQFQCFFEEQKNQLHRTDTGISEKKLRERRSELMAYERLLRNLSNSVLRPRHNGKSYHITDFAVILCFHLHRWMRATLYDDWTVLTAGFDTQWDAYFRGFTNDVGGWRTGFLYQDGAEMLGYCCPMPRCGLRGMCEEFCVSSHCKERGFTAVCTTTTPTAQFVDKNSEPYKTDFGAFKASAVGQALIKPVKGKGFGRAFWDEFNKQFPQYDQSRMKPASSNNDTASLLAGGLTREKAFLWMRENQHRIAMQRPIRGSEASVAWETGF